MHLVLYVRLLPWLGWLELLLRFWALLESLLGCLDHYNTLHPQGAIDCA